MKTIEEREDALVKRELPHNTGTVQWRDGYREGLKVGYHFGATEQKAIDDEECMTMVGAAAKEVKQVMIDKACEWLEMYVEYWVYDDGEMNVHAMLEDFRKAMEE